MFTYTRAVLYDTLKDIKKIVFYLSIIVSVFTILIPLFKIIMNTGFLIANIVLLIVACGTFVYSFYIDKKEIDSKKELKKSVKQITKWIKRIVKFTVIIYSGCELLKAEYDVIALVLFLITVFGWLLELIFAGVCKAIEKKIDFIIKAFNTDMAPWINLGNAIRKIRGDKIVELDISEEEMQLLDGLAVTLKEDKKEEKQIVKIARKERRKQYRQEWFETVKEKYFFKK